MHAGRRVQGGSMMCLRISCKRQKCLQQTLRYSCHDQAESCKRLHLVCGLLQTELSNNLIYILYMFVLFVVVEKRKKSTFKVPSFSGCLLIEQTLQTPACRRRGPFHPGAGNLTKDQTPSAGGDRAVMLKQTCISKALGGEWCVGVCRDPRDCTATPLPRVRGRQRQTTRM